MSASRSRIVSAACALPSQIVTSESMEAQLGLDAGWIKQRTGVVERRIAREDEATSDFARVAALRAIEKSPIDAADVGLVLLATSTPDYPLPPTAPRVAFEIGATRAGAIDLTGACAGFLYALALADAHVRVHECPVVIIGANILSRRVAPDDVTVAPLFADGAGAVVLMPSDNHRGILATTLAADGEHADALMIPAGGSRQPMSAGAVAAGEHLMHLNDGQRVFRQAVRGMTDVGRSVLESGGLSIDDVNLWIPHQASSRIIRETGRQLGIDVDRTLVVVDTLGNSSAATIPIALALRLDGAGLGDDDVVLMTAAGAGFLSAAVLMRW
ncbi:MAG: beta-ketoacyl-ACP synthase 3 [Planctomycetota bacterium]